MFHILIDSKNDEDAGNMKQKWKTKGIQGLPWVPILYVWYEDTSKGVWALTQQNRCMQCFENFIC
ncbi:hypothetical protein T01_13331 [Trichinella spiralis]|uniref:Uncharacterized protein n=1 Tax=Trichinella spiralis TaxID=6334 RepID=A0A0V1AKP8_TRISP|nr:hypothetical protein T01_13331 [Trichinella spiralis]